MIADVSHVKDPTLANQGRLNLELAERHMLSLLKIRDRFAKEKPFEGLTVGMALHVTKETGVLVRTLQAGGAKVAITGCNPLSTQDDVAAALVEEGVLVWAYKGETKEDYYRFIQAVIDCKPQVLIDDGCDLVSEIHKKHPDMIPSILGGCEETTTGVLRLRMMERDGALKMPVVAVNDNKTKHLFDNYYGTGQSTIDGILRATNILFAGKVVVVLGYGSCGKGVAMRAQALGSNVIVTEVDPFRALQATMDGFHVLPMEKACKIADVFITVTGNVHVIRTEHMEQMKDGAMLANSGHFDHEIDVKGLAAMARRKRTVRTSLDEYLLPSGKIIYILGEGRLVNLAAAEGHPSEVMSLSFCGQALACEYIVKNKGLLKGVVTMPAEIDAEISRLQLEATGIQIDKVTTEQQKYLTSWEEGT